ncbi:hypothetical protein M3Y94_01206200 [Aphelenchoides besseyi]|nr:hypothetical protein M3Y94_01206200 [Aphelenchoides besseyi]KAI6228485.1 Chromo domain-containing protein [Aphelenchoides besseyi]
MSDIERSIYVVKNILEKKVYRKVPFYLVHWEGFDNPVDHTWEPVESFVGSENLLDEFEEAHKTAPKKPKKLSVKREVTSTKARKSKKRSSAECNDISATQEPPSKVKRDLDDDEPAIDSFLGDPGTWFKSQYRAETEAVKRILDICKVEDNFFVICAFSEALGLTLGDIEPTPFKIIQDLHPKIMLDYIAPYML